MATDLIADLPAEDAPNRLEEETVIKKAIANAFVAGADTVRFLWLRHHSSA